MGGGRVGNPGNAALPSGIKNGQSGDWRSRSTTAYSLPPPASCPLEMSKPSAESPFFVFFRFFRLSSPPSPGELLGLAQGSGPPPYTTARGRENFCQNLDFCVTYKHREASSYECRIGGSDTRCGGNAEARGHGSKPGPSLRLAMARHFSFRPVETTKRDNPTNRIGIPCFHQDSSR